MLLQQSHRRMPCHPMCWQTADMVVRTRIFQEACDGLRRSVPRCGAPGCAFLDGLLQTLPVVLPVHPRQRMLHVAQDGLRWTIRIGVLKVLARLRVVFTQRLEPALGFFS